MSGFTPTIGARAASPLGEISAAEVRAASGGLADWPIPIVLNRQLMDEPWDLIINVGQVVPHEVLGFANHNKNYFIGLAGKATICASHIMAASGGIENNLGNLMTPLRSMFNLAEERYLRHLPDVYVQIVMARDRRKSPGSYRFVRRRRSGNLFWRRPGIRASRTSRSSTSRSRKWFA